MAFTITFRTSNPAPTVEALAAWLTERGEPSVAEADDHLVSKALQVRFVTAPPTDRPPDSVGANLQAQLDVGPHLSLSRVVDTLFDVSSRLGADLHLAGRGVVSRAELWLLLADEQDRLRIAGALRVAREQAGDAEEVHRRLWATIASLRRGHDDRWDTTTERVVELLEVGGSLSLEQAQWHTADPQPGDLVSVPVEGFVHCLVWRWLSEAYPRLA